MKENNQNSKRSKKEARKLLIFRILALFLALFTVGGSIFYALATIFGVL